jgi:hypothetical protein
MKFIMPFLALLWALAMMYVVFYTIKKGWGPWLHSKRQKKQKIYAKIGAKQGRQEVNPYDMTLEFTQKVLVFDCDDGVKRVFEVHDDIWDWVEQGDDGELTYQGDLFVRFDARRPRHDHDKMFERLTRR